MTEEQTAEDGAELPVEDLDPEDGAEQVSGGSFSWGDKDTPSEQKN